ncbi:hypothetical protein GNF80_08445 [Clostridium perfringens]|nr:hypothetical protein [Clostridium perfringens]
MQETHLIGRLVTSNAGRDIGKSYIVIGVVDEYLLVANGATKTIKMPKKKKIKHVVLTEILDDELKSCIISRDKNVNLKIKRFLKLNRTNKEV